MKLIAILTTLALASCATEPSDEFKRAAFEAGMIILAHELNAK
jgi:hypothetical protein